MMLKISIVESPTRLRLVLEGKLIVPWVSELRRSWVVVQAQLRGRQPLIDLRDVTHISREGENALLELMVDGARFTCKGVFTRRVIEQLARRYKGNPWVDKLQDCSDD